jgi:multiple sugar transport system ATP-binding protein
MAQIEISNLCKSFKDDAVLKGLSLSVDKGEIVAVFGPSGTGKTVLLRLLAGIYPPDAGTIRLRGQDAAGSPPEKRGIGMAFQNFALFPHMTARDNIASALTARKVDAGEIVRRVDAVAALRANCPTDRSSEPRWRGLWSLIPTSCCWTIPCAMSTPSCDTKCASNFRRC